MALPKVANSISELIGERSASAGWMRQGPFPPPLPPLPTSTRRQPPCPSPTLSNSNRQDAAGEAEQGDGWRGGHGAGKAGVHGALLLRQGGCWRDARGLARRRALRLRWIAVLRRDVGPAAAAAAPMSPLAPLQSCTARPPLPPGRLQAARPQPHCSPDLLARSHCRTASAWQ